MDWRRRSPPRPAQARLGTHWHALARIGTHWAGQSHLEIEVAERLQAMIPCAELTRFNNSATEAVNSPSSDWCGRTRDGRSF
jgi:hypothetical protein